MTDRLALLYLLAASGALRVFVEKIRLALVYEPEIEQTYHSILRAAEEIDADLEAMIAWRQVIDITGASCPVTTPTTIKELTA